MPIMTFWAKLGTSCSSLILTVNKFKDLCEIPWRVLMKVLILLDNYAGQTYLDDNIAPQSDIHKNTTILSQSNIYNLKQIGKQGAQRDNLPS